MKNQPKVLKDWHKVMSTGDAQLLSKLLADEEKNFVLEFNKEIDGILINGVDIVTFNKSDQITDFKVMVRPLKAINMIHHKMGEMLMKMKDKA